MIHSTNFNNQILLRISIFKTLLKSRKFSIFNLSIYQRKNRVNHETYPTKPLLTLKQ